VAGGLRILEKIRAVDYDVFRRRPVLRALDWPLLLLRAA
jgi:phytoene synthase